MTTPHRVIAPVTLLLGLLLCVGCGENPTAPELGYQIAIFSGDRQVAPAGTTLQRPLVVRVLDADRSPVKGVQIAWSVEEAGGFVSGPSSPSVTDPAGLARVYRRLGRHAGLRGTTASVMGPDSSVVRFTSVAQVQGAVRMMRSPDDPGHSQRDTVRSTVAPYRVLVLDHNDRPVSGVIVRWSASYGSVPADSSLTDSSGVAESIHTLGPTAGVQRVRARVRGLIDSPVRFETTAVPGNPIALLGAGGLDQIGVVEEPIDPYVVRVLDSHDNAVEGVAIDWAVTEGGGSIHPLSGATVVDGGAPGPSAAAVHTLGPDEGLHRVMATAPELPDTPSVTFETTAVTAIVELEPGYYGWGYFTPAEVDVPAGSTVAWLWGICSAGWYNECHGHNITFEDDPSEPISSPTQQGGSHLRTFDEPGEFRYRCTEHSRSFTDGEVGVVRVQ